MAKRHPTHFTGSECQDAVDRLPFGVSGMRQIYSALYALAVLATCLTGGASAKDPIIVTIDRAKVMRLPVPADTVIVGNPGIADVTIHDRTTLILTGKMAGITNLVILDGKGNPIADEIVQVAKIQEGLVTVQRAGERFSYNCTPNCNNMTEVGDNKEFFENTTGQIQRRNAIGQGGTAPQ